MTRPEATELDNILQLVRRREEQVSRQEQILSRLPASGKATEIARLVLAELEETLEEDRARLDRLGLPGSGAALRPHVVEMHRRR